MLTSVHRDDSIVVVLGGGGRGGEGWGGGGGGEGDQSEGWRQRPTWYHGQVSQSRDERDVGCVPCELFDLALARVNPVLDGGDVCRRSNPSDHPPPVVC